MDSNITCSESSWLGYWDACVDGLKEGSAQVHMIWGGPGVCGTIDNTSWVLPALFKHLERKKQITGAYELDFLQVMNTTRVSVFSTLCHCSYSVYLTAHFFISFYTLPLLIMHPLLYSRISVPYPSSQPFIQNYQYDFHQPKQHAELKE